MFPATRCRDLSPGAQGAKRPAEREAPGRVLRSPEGSKLCADVERGLQSRVGLAEVGQVSEVPVEEKPEKLDLESEAVRGPSVNELVLARVPESEPLVLERRAADVHEEVPPDVGKASEREREQVDQRK